MISAIFEQFVEASPVSVMVRGIMERIFEPKALDDLFERTATKQYTKELLFSTVVGLMSLVVSGIHPTVSAAYKALEKVVGVSRPALYGKLNGMEPNISQALVRHSVENLKPVMAQFQLETPEILPGYPIRVTDGNHLGATEHRLGVLCDHRSGALPGQSIAVLDPQQKLVLDVFPCEDGHAQERSLFPEVLQTVNPQEVWIADRNFCTRSFLFGIAQRQAYFVIREHQNLPWQALTLLVGIGETETGKILEQKIQITDDLGVTLEGRRVVIQLHQPTRHGDQEVAVLTNLPAMVADALQITKLYLERWSIEGMFQVITDTFHCELNSLGYPRAALFVFCMAVVAFNILSTVKAALKTVHGVAKIESGLSDYYLVEEVQGTFRGMMIALPAPLWQPLREMSVEQFALTLQQLATGVNLKRFSSSPRGQKKAKPKPVFDPKHPHVSTARLLEKKIKDEKKNKRSP
jgi:Transposase DDE domain